MNPLECHLASLAGRLRVWRDTLRNVNRLPSFKRLLVLICFAVLAPLPAQAQSPRLSLNDLALDWIRGEYASPLLCSINGKPERGIRRIEIEPLPSSQAATRGRIRFLDIEADEATRCFTELGALAPNLLGEIEIRNVSTKPRATARRDFKAELRRNKGFEFDIVDGQLTVVEVRAGDDRIEEVDLKGGHVRVALIRRGSDTARVLAGLGNRRHLLLEIKGPSGFEIRLPLAMSNPEQSGPPHGPGHR